jgi:hypothetical protein
MQATQLTIPGFTAGCMFAYVIDNVYTPEECQSLINLSEAHGYLPAKEGDQTGRSNFRSIVDAPDVAAELFQRLHTFLPNTWRFMDPYNVERPRGYYETDHLAAINERLRFQRYTALQEFQPHVDGSFEREDGSQRTHITLQLYINGAKEDGGVQTQPGQFTGGATTFLDPMHYRPDGCAPPLDVIPRTGRVLLFEHDLLHCGSPVMDGAQRNNSPAQY